MWKESKNKINLLSLLDKPSLKFHFAWKKGQMN